jgi:tetratricopeptide (TPR) repeat protein
VVGLIVLLAGGAGAWWHFRKPPIEPPMPVDIQDAELLRAVQRARQKVLDRPRSADAWGDLGMLLEAHLYEPEADRCFAEAARLNPDDARWPYLRGLYALKYDPDHALPFLRQAASVARPEYRSGMNLRLGEALLERQEIDEADQLFREEWRRNPGDSRAAFGIGLIALARSDLPAAEEYLTTARKSPTARRPATAQLAALARARRDEKAAAAYEAEVAPRPGDAIAWPDPVVEQIIRLQVGLTNWESEALRLEGERRYEDAAHVYLRELEERPSARYYVSAGVDLALAHDYKRAIPLLREAIRLDPDSSQAHFRLAQVQFSRAERERLMSRDAPEVKEWFGEAIEEARRATKLKPDHAEAYLFWGLSLKYLGKPADAEAPLREGVACRPSFVELHLALGEVLRENGKREEAKTYLENARKLAPNDPRPRDALERLGKE